MPELALWKGFFDRDDVQALDPVDLLALIAVGVEVAENLPDIDGFLPRAAVRRVSWSLGPGDLIDRLNGALMAAGFIEVLDEPPGWLMAGWTEPVQYYKPGNSATALIAWGQRESSYWKNLRLMSAARKKKSRARRAASDSEGHT